MGAYEHLCLIHYSRIPSHCAIPDLAVATAHLAPHRVKPRISSIRSSVAVHNGRMKNRPIAVFLNSLGISGAEQQAIARAVLEDEGFTNSRKTNMAVEKESKAAVSLEARLAFHCSSAACRETLQSQENALPESRQIILVERDACEICGGSTDRHALSEMSLVMNEAGLSHVVVVGGTHPKWAKIREISPTGIEWRFVDGLGNVNQRDAGRDLKWGDVILIWAKTPAQHRVTNLYDSPRTIIVPTTGIAALAKQATTFARRQSQR